MTIHDRADVLRFVSDRIPRPADGRWIRVGVDGPDGAGKTTFADELADVLRGAARPVVRVSVDGFHAPRAARYRRGRDSPEGFWLDSYDYPRLRADVLDPFGPGGSGTYRPTAHDVGTDTPLAQRAQTAEPGSVLLVDGIFLHRDELAGIWDLSIFLDVPFAETVRRMVVRDGIDPDTDHPRTRRYVEGQRLYFAACDPLRRADVVIDNRDADTPRIVRG